MVLLPVTEREGVGRFLCPMTGALTQTLRLEPSDHGTWLEPPGLKGVSGVFHLAGTGPVPLAYARPASSGTPGERPVDVLHAWTLLPDRLLLTMALAPRVPGHRPLGLILPPSTRVLDCSLPDPRWRVRSCALEGVRVAASPQKNFEPDRAHRHCPFERAGRPTRPK